MDARWILWIAAGALALLLIYTWVVLPWSVARRSARAKQRIVHGTISELLEHVRSAIRFERWDSFGAAVRLASDDTPWNDAALLAALRQLYAERVADDAKAHRSGRDSNVFEFHDCSLAEIVETLENRARGSS